MKLAKGLYNLLVCYCRRRRRRRRCCCGGCGCGCGCCCCCCGCGGCSGCSGYDTVNLTISYEPSQECSCHLAFPGRAVEELGEECESNLQVFILWEEFKTFWKA